jgi:hypothetical protein
MDGLRLYIFELFCGIFHAVAFFSGNFVIHYSCLHAICLMLNSIICGDGMIRGLGNV